MKAEIYFRGAAMFLFYIYSEELPEQNFRVIEDLLRH